MQSIKGLRRTDSLFFSYGKQNRALVGNSSSHYNAIKLKEVVYEYFSLDVLFSVTTHQSVVFLMLSVNRVDLLFSGIIALLFLNPVICLSFQLFVVGFKYGTTVYGLPMYSISIFSMFRRLASYYDGGFLTSYKSAIRIQVFVYAVEDPQRHFPKPAKSHRWILIRTLTS